MLIIVVAAQVHKRVKLGKKRIIEYPIHPVNTYSNPLITLKFTGAALRLQKST